MLQSTADGAVAAVNGKFSATLIEALKGKGRAKIWDGQATDKMYVRYDLLRSHMKNLLANVQKITSKVDGSDGESEGVLATLMPVPKSKCTITIEGSPAAVNAEIILRRGRSGADERQPLSSQPAVIELEPDDYAVSLRLNDEAAETATPMPVDLYDHRSIVFTPAPAAAMRGGLESSFEPESTRTGIDHRGRAHRRAARCHVRDPQHEHRLREELHAIRPWRALAAGALLRDTALARGAGVQAPGP